MRRNFGGRIEAGMGLVGILSEGGFRFGFCVEDEVDIIVEIIVINFSLNNY